MPANVGVGPQESEKPYESNGADLSVKLRRVLHSLSVTQAEVSATTESWQNSTRRGDLFKGFYQSDSMWHSKKAPRAPLLKHSLF